jgi:hypothetical protein
MIEHLADRRARQIPTFIARAGRDEVPAVNDSADRRRAQPIRDQAVTSPASLVMVF